MNITESELQQKLMEKEFFRSTENSFGEQIMFECKEFSIGDKRIDILGFDDKGNIYVIELKKGIVDGNALAQVLAYGFSLKHLLDVNDIEYYDVRHVLVGSDIESRTSNCIIGLDDVCFIKFDLGINLESFDNVFRDSYFESLDTTATKISELICDYNSNDRLEE